MTDTRYRFELNMGSNGWVTNSTVSEAVAQRIRDHHTDKEMPEGEWWRLTPVTPPAEKASTPEKAQKATTRARRTTATKKATGEKVTPEATTEQAPKKATRARSPRGGSNGAAAKKATTPEFKAAE